MKIKVLFVLSLALLQLTAFSATPWLHVDGKQIKDPAGNRVILRGVSTESIGTANGSSKNIQAVLDMVTNMSDNASNSQGWYTRIVRLPNGPGDFTNNPTGYATGTLKTAVDYATSKGLYAIIDLHFVAETAPNNAVTLAFWKAVAPVFKDYSNVLFEPYNEPINTSQTWSQFKTTMQSYVDLIRTYAPKNLICCGSPQWDQKMGDAATDPLTGTNLVYVVHMYNAHFHSPSNISQVEKCAAVHPMIMTEWGFHAIPSYPTETVTNYGKPITDWMESLGVSWTTWCASDDWAPAMFSSSWALLSGDCCEGAFTKDLLFTKRNSDQPTTSVEANPVMQTVQETKQHVCISQVGKSEFVVKLLNAPQNRAWSVIVFDFNGKKVFETIGTGSFAKMGLQNIAPGVYFCKTLVEGSKFTNAMVIK
jgi:endoglucanase